MDYSFEDCITPIIETAVKIEIEEAFQKRIMAFVEELIKVKKKEDHHKKDNQQEVKRFSTGYLGEAALEKLFSLPIIDWTIGNSSTYHVPDIPGYSVGIKTVEYGKFPIIFKRNNYPQIICVADPAHYGTVFVCGLGTVDVLNTYQSDDLILDPKLRARGTKTGFYGFDHLVPIESLNDIEPYKKAQANRLSSYVNAINASPIATQKKCPQCGKAMAIKDGRFGKFWGCTGYPACKHTENYTS